nr:uncharacterized protein LOC109157428 [Ipomoea trifida]
MDMRIEPATEGLKIRTWTTRPYHLPCSDVSDGYPSPSIYTGSPPLKFVHAYAPRSRSSSSRHVAHAPQASSHDTTRYLVNLTLHAATPPPLIAPLGCGGGARLRPGHAPGGFAIPTAFLVSYNIAPCQLTPNGHRFITYFITRCHEVKVAASLSLLLHVFHVNQSGPFLHLQPMSGYSFVTSLPSLIKNWKEKFVNVSYNPGAAGYGFNITWIQFISPFTPPSYEGLDADRTKLCGDDPFDHRRYHDPLLVNQLNDGPPLHDEESLVGVMADPTLDGVESGAIFSPPRTTPPQVITINNPNHAKVDRPSGPPPGSPSIEYDPHDPLFARRHSGTSHPRPLRPYHPYHIDFIRRGVREMVPATTQFWMDSSPMNALSSHLVGDLMNASMQAIGLQQRLQEASQDYAASEEALRELGDRHQQLQVMHEATLKELDALKTAHTAL